MLNLNRLFALFRKRLSGYLWLRQISALRKFCHATQPPSRNPWRLERQPKAKELVMVEMEFNERPPKRANKRVLKGLPKVGLGDSRGIFRGRLRGSPGA